MAPQALPAVDRLQASPLLPPVPSLQQRISDLQNRVNTRNCAGAPWQRRTSPSEDDLDRRTYDVGTAEDDIWCGGGGWS